ncbi:TetR/AcrR family transcriptional regulator [Longispora sp. NPDC051575]|uniref:TetR/AcrR family transcriptional regulator n=1 Tax=Longispora sp. NPDC051575 TaxID=3154943 RepID=UPI00343B15DE
MDTANPAAEQPAQPRDRLVATAARLFYAEGIHAVGVDRLTSEASVTKATFYRHFPTKDDLVLAYVRGEDLAIRSAVDGTDALAPDAALDAIFADLGAMTCGPQFRGCPFINAAAEYPDPEHPVRAAIDAHRSWFRDALATRLESAGHPAPQATAGALMLLRDGALVGGYLDDAERIRATLREAVTALAAPAQNLGQTPPDADRTPQHPGQARPDPDRTQNPAPPVQA